MAIGCGSDGTGDRPDAERPDGGQPEPADDASAASDAGSDDTSLGETSDAGPVPDASNGLCTSCGDCEESQRISSALHVAAPIDYADLPPLGGNHAPCWTRYGVHASEVLDERWVHNLEHGAVVFLYNCPEGCPDQLARLTELAASRPFALVTPYAALPGQFAAVAWGHRLVSECFDEEVFRQFYESYVDKAPESISGDGSC